MYFSDSLIRFNFFLDPISIIFVFSMLIYILLISHHWLTEVAFICNLEEIFWIFLLVWWFAASSANRDMFSNAGFKNMSFKTVGLVIILNWIALYKPKQLRVHILYSCIFFQNISYNFIGDEGALAFSEMLESNTTLKTLSLQGDLIVLFYQL